MVKPTPAFDRVMSRVVKVPGGCWLWTGKAGDRGYGLVVTRRRSEGWKISEPVHRVVYGRLVGEIPEGADLHHVCRVKTCVNPDHLRPVDRQAHYDEHRAERRSQFCKKLVALETGAAFAFFHATLTNGTRWNAEDAAAAGQCHWHREGQRWVRGCER